MDKIRKILITVVTIVLLSLCSVTANAAYNGAAMGGC